MTETTAKRGVKEMVFVAGLVAGLILWVCLILSSAHVKGSGTDGQVIWSVRSIHDNVVELDHAGRVITVPRDLLHPLGGDTYAIRRVTK